MKYLIINVNFAAINKVKSASEKSVIYFWKLNVSLAQA